MWYSVYEVWSLGYDITPSLGLAHTPIVLSPTKWNKDNKGAWRMDLPVDIDDTYDDGCEDEIDKNDYQVDTGDRESESSMSVSSN